METIDSLVETTILFYLDNDLDIPTSVVEYIKRFPPGLSRQVLKSKYNISCSDFVKLLNPNYIKPLSAKDRLIEESKRLNFTILSDTSLLSNNRDSVTIKYNECGHTHTTTISSIYGTKLGCRLCKSGNLAWKDRKEELVSIVNDTFDAELVSDIPDNQTGYVTLKHRICGSEYTTQLLGIVSPNSKLRGTCPNCRPTDRRVVLDTITFGSQFEADCFSILRKLNPELHVPYSKYFNTTRRWNCDFKIGNYWIEVSNFKTDYKNYFSNIADKQELVESNGQYFFFITSTKELEEIVSLM